MSTVAELHADLRAVSLSRDHVRTLSQVMRVQQHSQGFLDEPVEIGPAALDYIILRLLSNEVDGLDVRRLRGDTTPEQHARLRNAILACKGLAVLWIGAQVLSPTEEGDRFIHTLTGQSEDLVELFYYNAHRKYERNALGPGLTVNIYGARSLRKLSIYPTRPGDVDNLVTLLTRNSSLRELDLYIGHNPSPSFVRALAWAFDGVANLHDGLTRLGVWRTLPHERNGDMSLHHIERSLIPAVEKIRTRPSHETSERVRLSLYGRSENWYGPRLIPNFYGKWPNDLRARAWDAARETEKAPLRPPTPPPMPRAPTRPGQLGHQSGRAYLSTARTTVPRI